MFKLSFILTDEGQL